MTRVIKIENTSIISDWLISFQCGIIGDTHGNMQGQVISTSDRIRFHGLSLERSNIIAVKFFKQQRQCIDSERDIQ